MEAEWAYGKLTDALDAFWATADNETDEAALEVAERLWAQPRTHTTDTGVQPPVSGDEAYAAVVLAGAKAALAVFAQVPDHPDGRGVRLVGAAAVWDLLAWAEAGCPRDS